MTAENIYERYYIDQAGGGMPVYSGSPYQRGHGLGSILGGLLRGAMPLLSSVGKSIGRQMIRSGLDVASDVVSGGNVRDSLKRRAKEGALSLLEGGRVNKRRRPGGRSAISKKRPLGERYRKAPNTKDIFS